MVKLGGGEADKTARAQPLVVFSLDGQRYAVPLETARRTLGAVALTPLPGAPAIVLGVVDLAGEILPVIDMRKRFGHPPRELRLSDALLVATTTKRTVALLVDETKGVLEVSADRQVSAAEILPGLEVVAGAVRLPDGLVLIHDLERLLSLDDHSAIDEALRSAGREGAVP